ncbi:hypothetical protein THAOC_15307 [Thalassiosira oceanica]|uniref:Uncharacterized protein n=1 Tax=Thalassiosira oceanica TaxID=159749 RepID=K0SCZ7_THAOC|nr:hypothetical protein THAOC_15307 [Thalassiosira oceanica]|eukprot:EJK64003.1 hypothetical protein THAOC_15307 [Thalassiosira oceanica]
MALPLLAALLLFSIRLSSLPTTLAFKTPSLTHTRSCYCRSDQGPRILLQQSLGSDDDGADDGDDLPSTAQSMSLASKIQVLSYRAAVGGSALLLTVLAVDDTSFLEGTGANIDALVGKSTLCLPFVCGASSLVCPLPDNRVVRPVTRALGSLTLMSGILAALQLGVAQQYAWGLSLLSLMVVSVREVYYFGPEYKQECGLTLFMLPLMLDADERVPFTTPLCALGCLVLAFGKLFEPLSEDLQKTNSEFLAK